MPYEKIENLIEKFSCELILADLEEENSLSGLLPLLKHLHTLCMRVSLKSEAKEIIRAKNLINEGIKNNSTNVIQQMTFLETFISDLSTSISELLGKKDQMIEIEEKNMMESDFDNRPDDYSDLEKKLEDFSALIGVFCPGEIPDFGDILNNLDSLIEVSKEIEPSTFYQISKACKEYVENMTFGGY